MAPPQQPIQEVATIYSMAKDWIPIGVSFFAVIYSFYANSNSKKTEREHIRLQAKLDNLNNKRHWRREKIYTLADEICEIATDYWLTEENDLDNKKRALSIKHRIVDIELNANAIGLDISNIIARLDQHATGGLFESSGRKALATDNEKFLQLRLHSQKIKKALGKK